MTSDLDASIRDAVADIVAASPTATSAVPTPSASIVRVTMRATPRRSWRVVAGAAASVVAVGAVALTLSDGESMSPVATRGTDRVALVPTTSTTAPTTTVHAAPELPPELDVLLTPPVSAIGTSRVWVTLVKSGGLGAVLAAPDGVAFAIELVESDGLSSAIETDGSDATRVYAVRSDECATARVVVGSPVGLPSPSDRARELLAAATFDHGDVTVDVPQDWLLPDYGGILTEYDMSFDVEVGGVRLAGELWQMPGASVGALLSQRQLLESLEVSAYRDSAAWTFRVPSAPGRFFIAWETADGAVALGLDDSDVTRLIEFADSLAPGRGTMWADQLPASPVPNEPSSSPVGCKRRSLAFV